MAGGEDSEDSREYPCLLRATDGFKSISTEVSLSYRLCNLATSTTLCLPGRA